jgi:uncharacterized protein YqfA (UPF0365 family)
MNTYIFIGIAIVVLIMLLTYFVPLTIYMAALNSGVNIEIGRLIGMRIRQVPPKLIVNNLISAHKADIAIEIDELEALYLTGGDVSDVVKAMIAAKSGGLGLDFKKASKASLAGLNVYDKVREELNKKGMSFGK